METNQTHHNSTSKLVPTRIMHMYLEVTWEEGVTVTGERVEAAIVVEDSTVGELTES